MKYPDRKLLAAMTPRKSVLYSSLLLAGTVMSGNAYATTPLPTGSILKLTAGVYTCVPGGGNLPCTSAQVTNVATGSYFGMDMNGDSKIEAGEKTAIALFQGVPSGAITTASGSHTGAPNGSEDIGIDKPWEFFGNTGMDFVKTPVTLLSGTAPNFTLDFSGWNVTWNGIPAINMGANAWAPLNCSQIGCTGQTFTNGSANLTWDGTSGDPFTLTYSATVPAGDPSGFGGVHYYLYLTGTVIVPQPITSDAGTVTPMTVGSHTFASTRIGDSDLAAAGIPSDPDTTYYYPLHLYYDFTVNSTTSANIVIPLASPLPANAVYRLYNPNTSTWSNFQASAGNLISSAPGTPGTCPAAGNSSYALGLTQGDYCVELTIVQGGVDDTDSNPSTISDPGGIAVGTAPAAVDTRTSGTSGCSISPKPVNPFKRSDWFLLLGFVTWLGFWRRKRHS